MTKYLIIGLVFIFCSSFGQNDPSVEFSSIPAWGQSDLLQGKVHNATIGDHGVAVYIFVEEAGGWWTKPSFAAPVTMILPDSTFTTNIVSGGLDRFAIRIIAFLIPLSASPPLLAGADIPDSMFSLPYEVTCRPHGERLISWSGHDWIVKRSVGEPLIPMGPGPNIFNDNDTMVWVDAQQRLHLRLAKKDGTWHCSEVICKTSQGYGNYEFDVGSRVDLLDPRIITGIFTWDDCSPFARPPNDFFREIDIEFSRWGDPLDKNSQYVIQPYYITENIHRFNMDLTGTGQSSHSFYWTADSIVFHSAWGDSSHSWKYTDAGHIPVPGAENIRINLWLMNGWSPTDDQDAEVILNSVMTGVRGNGKTGIDAIIFPNPTDEGCIINIHSEIYRDVAIELVGLQGMVLKNIFRGKISPGQNRIEWDGKRESGDPVRPGLYFICIRDKNETRYFKILKW